MNARYVEYAITREAEYGNLYVVRYRGRKVGTSQTHSAAQIIRHRHYNRSHA